MAIAPVRTKAPPARAIFRESDCGRKERTAPHRSDGPLASNGRTAQARAAHGWRPMHDAQEALDWLHGLNVLRRLTWRLPARANRPLQSTAVARASALTGRLDGSQNGSAYRL